MSFTVASHTYEGDTYIDLHEIGVHKIQHVLEIAEAEQLAKAILDEVNKYDNLMMGFAGLDIGVNDIYPVFNGKGELAIRWIERWYLGLTWYYDIAWVHELQ